MRKIIFPLVVGLAAAFIAGCAGPDQKLGRGLSNTSELVRWGEMRQSVQENSILKRPGYGYYGVVHGFHRSLARAGLGVYEVATFPIPSYDPILTDSFSADPAYPSSYKPDDERENYFSHKRFQIGVNESTRIHPLVKRVLIQRQWRSIHGQPYLKTTPASTSSSTASTARKIRRARDPAGCSPYHANHTLTS